MELKMKTKLSRSPSYLVRNPYTYCFRMNVPKDLQPYIGKKELRYSLKTGYLSTAKYKARIMAGQVQRLFKFLREGNPSLMKLSENQIQELIDRYLKDLIKSYEKPLPPFGTSEEDVPPFTDQETLNQYLRDLDIIKEEYITDRAMGEYSRIEESAVRLLKENGIDEIDKNSTSYWKLCEGLMLAEIKGIELHKDHLLGKSLDNVPSMQPHELEIKTTKQESVTLFQAAKDYWDEYSHNWKPRTKTDYRIVLDHILDTLGADTQLHTIDYNTGKRFRDGLSNGQISKSGKPLSVPRVNFHLDIANTIYTLATKMDKNLDRVNPFSGLRLREKVRADKKQDPFSKEELKKLFCLSPEYGQDTHRHAHHFWIPLIGLYTGARLEEICQLLKTDIINRDGYWCLDIKEHDAPDLKSVKQGERRIVPLHPFIINDLKFINYFMSIDESEIRVFHKLNRVNNRWGHAFGQWFGKFKKRCGIEAPARKKTFHSFRHTLINFCKQNDIAEKHTSEFVGHRNRKITYGVYGKQFKPQKLYKEIVAKLNYGIDLSHLKNSKYVIKE